MYNQSVHQKRNKPLDEKINFFCFFFCFNRCDIIWKKFVGRDRGGKGTSIEEYPRRRFYDLYITFIRNMLHL